MVRPSSSGRHRQAVVVKLSSSSLSGSRRFQAVAVRPSLSGRHRQAVVVRLSSSGLSGSRRYQAISIVFRRQIKVQAMKFSTRWYAFLCLYCIHKVQIFTNSIFKVNIQNLAKFYEICMYVRVHSL